MSLFSARPRFDTRAPADADESPKGHGCLRALLGGGAIGIGILLLAAILPVWGWYWWRIEPESGQFAVLLRKTGENLPAGEILATRPGQKGIQLAVIPEGRYFRNPYSWDWKICRVTDITAGKLAVKVRLYGQPLPPGEIIAKEGFRGIESDVLAPGKYRINPYAHDVIVQEAINIAPGHVGVKTSLVGLDVLDAVLPEKERNSFLVGPGLKGVCAEVLDPGTYYLNPFMWAVVEVNLQSQRFEIGGEEGSPVFLTADGFPVKVEGTIEFNIRRNAAAMLTHQVGDMDDIIKKLILPRARGFIRIEGSKKKAVEFIVGETRQQFQDQLEKHLKDKCDAFGVSVNSVLIRSITPPNDIASVIRDRELAAQDAKKIEQQMEQARSRAELVRQEMLAQQNSRKVESETIKLKATIGAQQGQSVKVITAERELAVATIDKEAAEAQAKAVVITAEAERDVIRMTNEAEARVLGNKVAAFGNSGLAWAQYNLYSKLGPRIQSVMTGDQAAATWVPTAAAVPTKAPAAAPAP